MGQNIKSLAACVCMCARVLGTEYLENGQRQRFGSKGTPTRNDIWQIDWSHDRCRHVTKKGRGRATNMFRAHYIKYDWRYTLSYDFM